MRVARPPDWLIYAAAVLGLAVLAVAKQERADAPPAPPPIADAGAGAGFGLSPGMRTSKVRKLPAQAWARMQGTAFSVSDAGVWLTARHVVSGCRQAAVLVAPGRGVQAKVSADRRSDVAVLITQGGSSPLPLALDLPLKVGQRAFHPGFPQGAPGETASRLLGAYLLRGQAHGDGRLAVLAWAEVGRTGGLQGSLSGLSGAPVLDKAGRVIGVTLAESPRRGRIYSAPQAAIRAALKLAGRSPDGFASGQPITTDNYGRAADSLRRDLRVAPVVCLD